MCSEREAERVVQQYADTVRRLCMVYLKNKEDTEDIFQTVFMKYILRSTPFENEEHEKAWIIRVTINACKDLLKSFFHSHTVSFEELTEQADLTVQNKELLETVLALPKKYKEVIYLHYYEGYTAPQIGQILKKNVNTVYTLLSRAKEALRNELGGDAVAEQ